MVLKIACTLALIDFLSIGVLIPILHKHLLTIGGTHLIHGILGTIVALITFLAGPIIGSLSDTKGRSYVLKYVYINSLISYALLFFSSSLILFSASRIIAGISTKTQTLLKTILSDNIPTNGQTAAYGKLTGIGISGFIVGPIIGGYLYQKTKDLSIISPLLSIASLICIGLTFLIPNKKIVEENDEKSLNLKEEIVGSFTKLTKINWKLLWDVFSMKFLLELAFMQFYSTIGFVLIEVFELDQIHMGYVMSYYGSLFVITNLTIAKVNKFLPENRAKKIFVTFKILTITFFCFFMTSNIYIYILFFLPLAYTKSIFDASFLEMLTDRIPKNEKGITMGSYDSIMSLANLITPLFMGIITQYYNINVARMICIIPATAATLLSFYFFKKPLIKVNKD